MEIKCRRFSVFTGTPSLCYPVSVLFIIFTHVFILFTYVPNPHASILVSGIIVEADLQHNSPVIQKTQREMLWWFLMEEPGAKCPAHNPKNSQGLLYSYQIF